MSFSVTFEETGEERQVLSWCRRCFKTEPDEKEIQIVSPRNMGHAGSDGGSSWTGDGETACGIDATRDDWWHRL